MSGISIDVRNYLDGNGVELYRDKPEEEWPRPVEGGGVAMQNAPFDLQALLEEAG
jgi:catechol 2,3-dioxygenase